MSTHPGAQLSYGLDLGDLEDLDDSGWYDENSTFDAWEEQARKVLVDAGLDDVQISVYGNLVYGDPLYLLHTRQSYFYAYDTLSISPADLEPPEGHSEKLLQAWRTLFGTESTVEPSWLITLTYG